jgi:hypothetical protein
MIKQRACVAPLKVVLACHALETLRQEQCQASSLLITEIEEHFSKK